MKLYISYLVFVIPFFIYLICDNQIKISETESSYDVKECIGNPQISWFNNSKVDANEHLRNSMEYQRMLHPDWVNDEHRYDCNITKKTYFTSKNCAAFDVNGFLKIIRNKTISFVGDSMTGQMLENVALHVADHIKKSSKVPSFMF